MGTYLVKLSAKQIIRKDSTEAAKLLKIIGDFERIGDHSVNILESAEELDGKGLTLSPAARGDLERTSDHCSNIAGCVTDMASDNLNLHQSLRDMRDDSEEFRQKYKEYAGKYA